MNMDNLTVLDYQLLRAIKALDRETRTDFLEFLRTHNGSDIDAFNAGLNELLAKKKARAH